MRSNTSSCKSARNGFSKPVSAYIFTPCKQKLITTELSEPFTLSGNTIHYGFHQSPFGKYVLALTSEERICALEFADNEEETTRELHQKWSESELIYNPRVTTPLADQLFSQESASPLKTPCKRNSIPAEGLGSPAKDSFWRAGFLPIGIRTYQQSPGTPGHRRRHWEKPGGLSDPLSQGGSQDGRDQWIPVGIKQKIGIDRMGSSPSIRAVKLVCIHGFSS